jgi:hypothetical protein
MVDIVGFGKSEVSVAIATILCHRRNTDENRPQKKYATGETQKKHSDTGSCPGESVRNSVCEA